MTKKYILTEETINWHGRTLHRIKALRSFADVKEGDLGGWIESEENLSHDGDCWVYDNARVFDNARIFNNAEIFSNAEVFEDATICNYARIFGNAKICNNARIFDKASVFGNAKIYGDTEVFGKARISQTANISKTEDYLNIGPLGSRNDFTTFFKGENGDILVNCGCFNRTIEEFEKKVEKVHGESEYGLDYKAFAALAKLKLNSHN